MLQNAFKSSFRYDIIVLRAIAIIGVVLYHFKVNFFEGGFAGVDVFFVISGYLMSRVILGQINKGTFSFGNYFEKRLYRIVPALLFMVATVAVICFFTYLPYDYKANLQNAESSILFLSNIFYWHNSPSYFDASADTNLFLHTWSLSVEWQFYLVYPFILLLFDKLFKNRSTFSTAFIIFTIIFFAGSVATSNFYNSSFSFYMLPTRAWEMLLGGVAFFAEGKIKNSTGQKTLAITGYLLILSGFFILNESLLWPGFYTLIPVTGAFFVIIANYSNFMLVRQSSLQFIGKISYSLYLWHWPVYVISQYYGLGTGVVAVVVYSILSGGLAYVSYKYVESVQFNRKRVVVLGVAVLFTGVFAADYFNANRLLYSNKTLLIANNIGIKQKHFYNQYRKDTCFAESMRIYKNKPCLCFEAGKKNILLIGDSHLAQLSQSLREGLAKDNLHFLQATAPATLPTIKSYYNKKNNLRELMDFTYHDFIPKNAGRIDGVIISANWAGQRVVDRDSILYGIKEAVVYIKRYNIPVVIIGQTERYSVPYPTVAARSYKYGSNNHQFYLDGYTLKINSFLKDNLKGVYVNVLNEHSVPPLSHKNVTYMRDKDHVTKYGADLIVAKIKKDAAWKRFITDLQ
ncbi:acyltransferase family protein [Flavobacterium rivuli]|uniref:acyltransferase family protein n=1 Tax=Flavobacterium rivuli TaxID=498301 RepID=UPI000379B173|nr:acyltransferase family protein [Flavobacterium rivuli]